MTYRLANSAEVSARQDRTVPYYDWTIFVQATDEELDAIEFVTYFLHPTFPNPVHNSSDRWSNFALRARGWGTFEVGALIHLKDGTTKALTHELDFSAAT